MHQTETIPQPLQDRDRALDWLTAASPVLLIAFFYYRYMAVYALLQWAGLTRMQAPSALAAGVWSALLLSAHTPFWVAAIAGAVAALVAYAPYYLYSLDITQIGFIGGRSDLAGATYYEWGWGYYLFHVALVVAVIASVWLFVEKLSAKKAQ